MEHEGRPVGPPDGVVRSSAALYTAADALVRRGYGYVLPLRDSRVPIALLRGPSRATGRPATMLVAGAPRWVDYLPNRFFAAAPSRVIVGHAPVWRLPRRLRELRGEADLTVARIDRLSARLWFDDDYLTVPEWIGSSIPLPVDVATLARRSNSVAEDVRRTRLAGYTVDVSHAAADFDLFYRRYFVPYIRARYGSEAYVPGVRRLRASFRCGGLLWVLRDGQRVAGQVYTQRAGRMVLVAIGAIDLAAALQRHGAMAALYVRTLEFATALGCTEIDLRGTRPAISDGLLRYKRKWGAVVYDRVDTPYSALLHWNRLDGAALGFLAASPPIFRVDEGLAAVAVAERPSPWTADASQSMQRELWVPGLRRLAILARPPLPAAAGLRPSLLALDLDAFVDGGPRALLAALRAAH